MKYYSEETRRFYDTEEAAIDAEKKALAEKEERENKIRVLNETRAERAKEIDEAKKAVDEAKKKYTKLVNDFIKDYGKYHYTRTTTISPFDFFVDFFS